MVNCKEIYNWRWLGMQVCNKCNSQVDDAATFCSKCGAKLNGQEKVFSHNGISVDLTDLINRHGWNKINAIKELRMRTNVNLATAKGLVDEAYRGTIYENKKLKIKKPIYKKWWFWTAIIVLVISFVVNQGDKTNTVSGSSLTADGTGKHSTVADTSKVDSEPRTDKSLKTIMDGTSLSEQESKAVFEDLKSVGFKEVSFIKKGMGEGIDKLQAFIFTCDGVDATVTIEKRKTYYIGASKIVLFDAKKGGKLDDINNYRITSEKETSAIISAETYVKQGLKAPSTAEFPGKIFEREKWDVGRNKDMLQVTSYVDSENSFGAMIRSNFVVQMDFDTEELIYLLIGDQVVFGEPYKEKSTKK